MQIPVDFVIRSTVDPAAFREHASRRLFFALRRFEDRVRRVTVRLEDLNGPKRGVDSRCAITAELTEGRPLVVEATTAWPTASMTEAARRLNEAIRRDVAKARGSIRRPRRNAGALRAAV